MVFNAKLAPWFHISTTAPMLTHRRSTSLNAEKPELHLRTMR
jgi:hypothetical protein